MYFVTTCMGIKIKKQNTPLIMQKFLIFIALLLCFNMVSVSGNAQYHERDWDWKPYASLMKSGKTFMVLYYGTPIDGYNGKVRWKFINRSANPIFKIILNDQTFHLIDGSEVVFDKRKFSTNRVNPGGFAMTLITQIEENDFKGIDHIVLAKPEVTIDFGGGKVYEWNKLGTIEKGIQ